MHVHIVFKPDTTVDVEIDGVNIAKHVRHRDFRIGMENLASDGEPEYLGPVLHLALRPATIVVDGEFQPYAEFELALAESMGARA